MCLIQESGTLHEDSGVAYCCHLISMTYVKLDDMEVIDDKQYGFSNIQLSKR
jgi:hypothetical protein